MGGSCVSEGRGGGNLTHWVLRAQAKTKELKNSLNQEFQLIHELCLFVLNASQKPELIRATLSTLHAFLSWVPLAYIFNSNLVEVLLKLFPQQPFRNVALQCLTEVSASPLALVAGMHAVVWLGPLGLAKRH